VTQSSPLYGTTLRAARFADVFEVVIVGMQRARGVPMSPDEDIADVLLRTGDVLLVQGSDERIARLRARAGLLVLDGSYGIPHTSKAGIAVGIMVLVVAAAAFKFVPIAVAAVAGVALMMLARCMKWEDAARAMSPKVILLVAASLALGAALTRTGGTDYLAAGMLTLLRGVPPEWLLAVMMALMAALTNFVSNNAAAAIGTPIAVSMASQLGVSAEPLVLAILFGANFCYATPMAYQTNLMVMNAAGYRFSDFLRGGIPLLLIMLAGCALLLPKFFPF